MDHRSGTAIDRVFADVARRMPDAIAVKGDGDETLTYAELDRQAADFARFLRMQDVGRGDAVVLLTGRSVTTIVALLGILKAAAFYVPLDVDEPPERRDRMLADCAPKLILTAEGISLGADWGGRVFNLRDALSRSTIRAGSFVSSSAGPVDPACVMYTSGSTGQPKGVVVPHRGVTRLVLHQDYAPFGAGETFLHMAPLAFDASTFEIWGALLNGGTVAVVAEARPSLDAIAEAVAHHKATVAWFTAGLFSLLVDHRLEGLRPLRCILAGGDVLSPSHVARAYAGLPECRIVNGYGPTENTTFTCCYPIPREGRSHGPIPIGRPIGATRVQILDDALRPVAPGEKGQIACAGDGLALGYLGREQLTAEKFVTIDVGASAPERVYLTGDLGRRRSDGVVEFFGRLDTQVKIRGKRVEIGEIENALRSDPAILDAVVAAHDAPPDGKRLTAYLTLRDTLLSDADRSKRALARLRSLLPDYMIPAEAVVLPALPLTPNGKIDRARLPAAAQHATRPVRQASKPNGLEDTVAAIWADTLSRPDVDRDANFLDQGGSSLTLMALHAALRSTLSPPLPLMAVFQHTSVRALARHLESAGYAPCSSARPEASTSCPMPAFVPANLAGAMPR